MLAGAGLPLQTLTRACSRRDERAFPLLDLRGYEWRVSHLRVNNIIYAVVVRFGALMCSKHSVPLLQPCCMRKKWLLSVQLFKVYAHNSFTNNILIFFL